MKNIRKYLLWSVAALFVIFEAVMFHLIVISNVDTELNLRFISIIAAAVFAVATLIIELATTKPENEKPTDIILNKTDGNFIRIAMLFTLLADYFMVGKEIANDLAGISVFIGTQICIFLHIYFNDSDKKFRIANTIVRLSLMTVFVIVAIVVLGEYIDAMSVISVLYYANLCTNAIFAHRIGRGGIMLTIGLVLFALCDINVALSGLSLYYGGFNEGTLLYNLVNADIDMIWLFYIPSQTLIPLTLIIPKNKKTEAVQKTASI